MDIIFNPSTIESKLPNVRAGLEKAFSNPLQSGTTMGGSVSCFNDVVTLRVDVHGGIEAIVNFKTHDAPDLVPGKIPEHLVTRANALRRILEPFAGEMSLQILVNSEQALVKEIS